MLVLAALARLKPDFAFALATPVVGVLVLVRLFLEDGGLAWDQAVDLVNPQLALRLAACAEIALAGWMLRPVEERPDMRRDRPRLAPARRP